MTIFSERLTESRKRMGWTRKRAANEFQLPYTTYSGYEQGTRLPYLDVATTMATKLSTTIEYLMGKTDNPLPITEKTKNVSVDLGQAPIVLSYNGEKATPEDLDVIKAIISRHKNEHRK